MTLRLALYEPDIPQNTGTMLRMAACLGLACDIIEPCGFPFSVPALRRAGMDYLDHARIIHHVDFTAFDDQRRRQGARLVLLTTRGRQAHTDMRYAAGDILMVGRESAGVPEHVHAAADAHVRIPMVAGLRSLNVAAAAAIVLAEACRQTGHWEWLAARSAAPAHEPTAMNETGNGCPSERHDQPEGRRHDAG